MWRWKCKRKEDRSLIQTGFSHLGEQTSFLHQNNETSNPSVVSNVMQDVLPTVVVTVEDEISWKPPCCHC